MISTKEQNFISIIILTHNSEKIIGYKLNLLNEFISGHFLNYEIIVVDNFSTDKTLEIIQNLGIRLTIIELSRYHSNQQSLKAGIDASVGDFILEIEDINLIYSFDVILELYKKSLSGYDFVFYNSSKTSISSRLYYLIINKYLKQKLSHTLGSSIMVLSSRRGQNKTSETGNIIVNRNISYLLSGLNSFLVINKIKKKKRNFFENVDYFIDTLIHYTNIIPLLSSYISVFFAFVSLVFLTYSVFAFFIQGTVEGWASTNTFLSFSFGGIFLMFSISSKILINLLSYLKNQKQYSYKSIDKI
jgi:dolichol-phosphate mannosyltransferase